MAGIKGVNASDQVGGEAWGIKVRRRARDLVRIIDHGYMELAEILYTVCDTAVDNDPKNASVWSSWGYTSFAEWTEEDLQIGQRTAERLRRIWYDVEVKLAGQLTREQKKRLLNLGMSRVRELIRVLSGSNADGWIEMAENITHAELCTVIALQLQKQQKHEQAQAVGTDVGGEAGGELPPPDAPDDIKRFKWRNFLLTPEQLANVDLAVTRAKEMADSKRGGHALDLICLDFLATNDFKLADDPEMVLRFLAKYERLLGRRLVVLDPDGWNVEYGIESLEKLADAVQKGADDDDASD